MGPAAYGPDWSNRMHGNYAGRGLNVPMHRSMHAGAGARRSGSINYGRMGIGGAAGLIALSQGQKAYESLRYGEVGNAMIHGTLMLGMGAVSYGAFTRAPWMMDAGRNAATNIMANAKGRDGFLGKAMTNFANAIFKVVR